MKELRFSILLFSLYIFKILFNAYVSPCLYFTPLKYILQYDFSLKIEYSNWLGYTRIN